LLWLFVYGAAGSKVSASCGERCDAMAYLGKFADGRGLPRQRAAAHLQLFFFPLREKFGSETQGGFDVNLNLLSNQ